MCSAWNIISFIKIAPREQYSEMWLHWSYYIGKADVIWNLKKKKNNNKKKQKTSNYVKFWRIFSLFPTQ